MVRVWFIFITTCQTPSRFHPLPKQLLSFSRVHAQQFLLPDVVRFVPVQTVNALPKRLLRVLRHNREIVFG